MRLFFGWLHSYIGANIFAPDAELTVLEMAPIPKLQVLKDACQRFP